MATNGESYVFYCNKLKSWSKGKLPPFVEIFKFSENSKLCVVNALDTYLKGSSEWRKNGNKSQLLLATMESHQDCG